jgi:hypothetical protein
MKVERVFTTCQKSQATWKNVSKVPKFFGKYRKIKFRLPQKILNVSHHFECFSPLKEKTTLKVIRNMKRGILNF